MEYRSKKHFISHMLEKLILFIEELNVSKYLEKCIRNLHDMTEIDMSG